MILTVTPNLALDITYTLEDLVPHRTHRARSLEQRAGGKGVNVARVLHRLDHDTHVLGLAGGATGALVRADLATSGLSHEVGAIQDESRRTIALVSEKDGQATLVNEPGPRLSGHEWVELTELVARAVPRASAAVFAGSLPPGAPQDGYAQLIAIATAQGVPTVLDTSGQALQHGVSAGPDIVKPNIDELRELTGTSDPATGAATLRDRGASAVIVSLGPDGLLAVTEQQCWRAVPDAVVRGNPTGAGDAAVAALAAGLSTGSAWPDRLRDATALSAAAVAAPAAGDFDFDHYRRASPTIHDGDAQPLEDAHAPRIDR